MRESEHFRDKVKAKFDQMHPVNSIKLSVINSMLTSVTRFSITVRGEESISSIDSMMNAVNFLR